MYAGHVACCPLMSHGEYTIETDWQTDGRQTITLRYYIMPRMLCFRRHRPRRSDTTSGNDRISCSCLNMTQWSDCSFLIRMLYKDTYWRLIFFSFYSIYIYVYSSRRQNRPTARIKKQKDRQTNKQTLQLIPQLHSNTHNIKRRKIT